MEQRLPSSVKIKSQFKGFEQLQKNLKEKLVAKVGIFSGENSRDDSLTNAQIGARHEFGVLSEGLPRRSFLKDPINLKRKELLKKADRIIQGNIDKVGGMNRIYELIGIYGEAIVQEAFETGGYGTWKPLAQSTIDIKGSSQILIDTSQLRKSITSKVE